MRETWNCESRFAFHASRSTVPVGDARLVQIVGRHLDVDLVADADADEIFPHLAGDVREHLVPVRQRDAKHGARQHLLDAAGQFDRFFFGHVFGPASNANRSAQNQPLFLLKKALDICRRPVRIWAFIMKCETTNAVLTYVLGVFALLGVIFALQTIVRTRETRSLQMAILQKNYMLTVQSLYSDALEYGKTHPDINRILQTAQSPKPATR